MKNMSFYPTQKEYEPPAVKWPDRNNAEELSQFQNGLGIAMHFADVKSVRHPVFFSCRDRGVLRLNHRTFVEVKIPDQLMPMLAGSPNVEVVLAHDENSFISVFAAVERVLRMPSYLDGELAAAADEAGHGDPETPPEPKWKRTPPRRAFELLLAKTGGEIVGEYEFGESAFVLAHDGRLPLLVSFFDEDDEDWLADEEMFNGEPPLWFSANGHCRSPLYDVGTAAEHLDRQGLGRLLPLAVMSNHINIINLEDIKEDWERTGVTVCYCSRTEEFIVPFGASLAAAAKARPKCRIPDETAFRKIGKALCELKKKRT